MEPSWERIKTELLWKVNTGRRWIPAGPHPPGRRRGLSQGGIDSAWPWGVRGSVLLLKRKIKGNARRWVFPNTPDAVHGGRLRKSKDPDPEAPARARQALRRACARRLCRARGGGHAVHAKSSPPGGTALSPGTGSRRVFSSHLLKVRVLEMLSAASSKHASGRFFPSLLPTLSSLHSHPLTFHPIILSCHLSCFCFLLFLLSPCPPSSPCPASPGDLWSLSQCFITG